MKVNMDVVLKGLDGKPLRQEDKDMTLGMACVMALSTPLEEDKKLGADKVVARWKLTVALHGGGEHDLSPEQLSELRGRLPQVLTLIAAGQCCELLSGS